MTTNELASVIETLLFIVGEPLEKEDIKKVANATEMEFFQALALLKEKYTEAGGILLKEFGSKLQMCTNPCNAPFVEDLLNPVQKKSLSQSALEVLSVIAYRQPVTRGEIEQIRGVKCDYTVMSLKQKGLIEEVGHKDTLGRPVLFGTTDLFLRHFGLSDLSDLPEQEKMELLEETEFDADAIETETSPLLQERRHDSSELELDSEPDPEPESDHDAENGSD